jgi:hypothetical protein
MQRCDKYSTCNVVALVVFIRGGSLSLVGAVTGEEVLHA